MLRPLHPDDLPALSSFHAETGGIRSAADGRATAAFIERTVARYTEDGFALSAVVLRDMGQFAGWAGLWVPWFLPEILPAARSGGRSAKRSAAADTPPRPDGHERTIGFSSMPLIRSSASTNPATNGRVLS